jgi:ribonuclease E
MANTTTPASGIGGRTDASEATPTGRADLAVSLPSKLRVHALAKLLAVSSKEVIGALAELGIMVGSAQSSIDRETAMRALAVLLPDPEPDLLEIDEVAQQSAPETPLLPVSTSPAPPVVFNAAVPVFLSPTPSAGAPRPRSWQSRWRRRRRRSRAG